MWPRGSGGRYFLHFLDRAAQRTDHLAGEDRRQLELDLPRTFRPCGVCGELAGRLIPPLRRILAAYIERGRVLGAASLVPGVPAGRMCPTTARGLLDGYSQGLNLLGAMSLLFAGGDEDLAAEDEGLAGALTALLHQVDAERAELFGDLAHLRALSEGTAAAAELDEGRRKLQVSATRVAESLNRAWLHPACSTVLGADISTAWGMVSPDWLRKAVQKDIVESVDRVTTAEAWQRLSEAVQPAAPVTPELEERAFWVLAFFLEDVLDPDFFGTGAKAGFGVDFVGGLGMRDLIVEQAPRHCKELHVVLGRETFSSIVMTILNSWVLSIFVGCMPRRLLDQLWTHLLLPSIYHSDRSSPRGVRVPQGIAMLCAFSLAALQRCYELRLKDTDLMDHLGRLSDTGAPPDEMALESGEILIWVTAYLKEFPEAQDQSLWNATTKIFAELCPDGQDRVWNNVQVQKQRIKDNLGECDERLIALARRTTFTLEQINKIREAHDGLLRPVSSERTRGDGADAYSMDAFTTLVRTVIPDFPLELCGRLYVKLDAFRVGAPSFAELVCGLSALCKGTLEDKLQVCFDLFDSSGRRALGLSDVSDLCGTLFRVALAERAVRVRAATLEDVESCMRWDTRVPSEDPFWRTFHAGDNRRIVHESYFGRSMLLRLLSQARREHAGGPPLVDFEVFVETVRKDPQMIRLFKWCLPQRPSEGREHFEAALDRVIDRAPAVQPPLLPCWCSLASPCRLWRRFMLRWRAAAEESLLPA